MEQKNDMTYSSRAQHMSNPAAQQLMLLMDEKKTNLSLAADVITKQELLTLADTIGPEICLLKTHIDIIVDFDRETVMELSRLAEKHRFMIFEDRKFADIGNTVKHQYQDGIYHIADWAHITNAHTVPGPGIVEALKDVGLGKERGLLLLAEMSSGGNLATGEYTQKTLELAKAHTDFVIGFISRRRLLDDPDFVYMTPGVKLEGGVDDYGQQYLTPDLVIGEYESDVIIVGRGIYQADDPLAVSKEYRKAGWEAYEKRCS